jgi:acyl-CoA synthetase (AMP-forming)/AMP-acid ligase II
MKNATALANLRPLAWSELAELTIPGLIDHRAQQMPFRVALSAQSFRGYRDRLTYSQLALYSRRIAAGLAVLGVRQGDRVAVYLDNDAGREAILTAIGCFVIGAVVVPVNIRSADDELGHALGLVTPVLIVTVQASAARIQQLTQVPLVLLDAPVEDALHWPEPTQWVHRPEIANNSCPHDLACLLFTSGTTGRSKAVMHSHRSMLAAGFAMGEAVGLKPTDLYQGAFPFFTSSCLNLGCMSAWVHGAGFVMEHWLSNLQRLRLVESECSTVYHGVPSVVQFMLDEAACGQYSLQRVRRIAYGGASMPPSTINRIAQDWPWMEQVQVWGMTESGPAGAWLPPKWLPEKAGLIGQAMSNCELQVVDDAGLPVREGDVGELCFRGPSMAIGYFDEPIATAETFRDGWLHTGDVVVEDENGLLRFVDRKKDLINRGGLKVSAVAVEAVLYRIPGVVEAAAVAVPHPRLGEDVAACIVAAPGAQLDPQAMSALCQHFLADYEVPKYWYFLDELPKNAMGKVLKRELRELVSHSPKPYKATT